MNISWNFIKFSLGKNSMNSAWIMWYQWLLLFQLSGLDCMNAITCTFVVVVFCTGIYMLGPENTYSITLMLVRAHFKIILLCGIDSEEEFCNECKAIISSGCSWKLCSLTRDLWGKRCVSVNIGLSWTFDTQRKRSRKVNEAVGTFLRNEVSRL